jgi:hypothetical protein
MQELLIVQIYLLVAGAIFFGVSLSLLQRRLPVLVAAGRRAIQRASVNKSKNLPAGMSQALLQYLLKRDIDNGVYYFRGGGPGWPGDWLRRDGHIVARQEFGS